MISSSNRKVHKDFFALLINLPFLWKNWPIRIIQTWKSSKKTRILLGNRCFLRFLTNIYWISQKVHQGKTYSFGNSGPHAKIQKLLSEGFWDNEKMSTRSYMVVFYPKPGLKGPYPRPGPCQNPKRLTTQTLDRNAEVPEATHSELDGGKTTQKCTNFYKWTSNYQFEWETWSIFNIIFMCGNLLTALCALNKFILAMLR